MRKGIIVVLFLAAALVGLSGCPLGAGKLTGSWQYVEPLAPADTALDTNFENNGRLRVTLVFGEKTDAGLPFTYTAERFYPDREPFRLVDNGAGVNWAWQVVQKVQGFYQTAAFDAGNNETIWPQLNTELNVAVSTWSTFELHRTADEDDYERNYYEMAETTSASSADNPLFWRALLGITPLDELLVAWGNTDQFDKTDLPGDLNTSIGPVQTYRRLAEDK